MHCCKGSCTRCEWKTTDWTPLQPSDTVQPWCLNRRSEEEPALAVCLCEEVKITHRGWYSLPGCPCPCLLLQYECLHRLFLFRGLAYLHAECILQDNEDRLFITRTISKRADLHSGPAGGGNIASRRRNSRSRRRRGGRGGHVLEISRH